MRMTNLVAIVVSVALFSWSVRAEGPKGLDKPEATRIQPLGASDTADKGRPVIQTCLVYPTAAVMEINDPGLRGTHISIRKRDKTMTLDALCAEKYPGASVSIPDIDNHLDGVVSNFLFVSGADAFGMASAFWIYDLSGLKVFEGIRSNAKPFTVTQAKGEVSLRYWTQLESLPCWPKEEGCWTRILTANGVEARLRASKQLCVVPNDLMTEDPSEVLQVFGPSELSLTHPKLRFLDGQATCNLAP